MRTLSSITGWFGAFDWRGMFQRGPRRPFVGLAFAACAGILAGEISEKCFGHGPANVWLIGPWISSALFFVLALLFVHFPRAFLCWALVFAGFMTLHLFRLNDPASTGLANELAVVPELAGDDPENEPASAQPPLVDQTLHAIGIILDEPRGTSPTGSSIGAAGGQNWRFTFALTHLAVHGRQWDCHAHVRVSWRNGPSSLAAGERLGITGTGAPVRGPRNPGEFDMAAFLRRRDIRTEIQCSGITDVQRLPSTEGWGLAPIPVLAQRFQTWTQKRLTLDMGDDPEAAAVVSTLILGLRSEPGLGDLEEPFQRTGTLHFFAIDGLKLSLFSLLVVQIFAIAGLRRQWAVTLILPLLVFYALATGFGPASLRAVIVAVVFAGGEWIDRPARALNSLGVAATAILLKDSNQIFDLGFQLTFLVVLSILLLGTPMQSMLMRVGAPDPFLPPQLFSASLRAFEWSRRKFIDLACVSCAASLGSFPLMLVYFHVVSPVSVIANVAVFPLALGMIGLGVMSLAGAWLPQIWGIWISNANWLLARMFLAAVRFFDSLPGGSFYATIPEGRWEQPAAEITVLDLARGARAIHLHSSAGGDWLIDTGRAFDFQRTVLPFLRYQGIGKLDGMILTQADTFHLGAASLALSELAPSRLFGGAATGRSNYQKGFARVLKAKNLSMVSWQRGDVFPFPHGTEWRVLYPPEHAAGQKAGDKALVLQLRVAEWRILFLGDSGAIPIAWLADNESPENLRSDVLVTGGALENSEDVSDLLEMVAPRLIVEDQPRQIRKAAAAAAPGPAPLSASVLSAEQSGAIRLRIYPRKIEAAGFLAGTSIEINR